MKKLLYKHNEDGTVKTSYGSRVVNPIGITMLVTLGLVFLIFALPALFGFYSVDPGERGVEFNKISGEYQVEGEGLHWRYPLFDQKWVYDVRDRIDTAEADSASSDLQVVTTTITVRYHPLQSELVSIHQTIGEDYLDKVIRPAVQESVKSCTARFTYTEMVQERPLVKQCMEEIISERLGRENIHTTTVDIVNFSPPPELTAAITAKEAARQEAQRQENLLQASEAKAQQQIAEAEGQAQAARLLAEIPDSHAYLYLKWLEIWNGVLPQVMAGEDVSFIIPTPGDS